MKAADFYEKFFYIGEDRDDIIEALKKYGEIIVDLCLEKAELDLYGGYKKSCISDTSILNVKELL